MYSEKLKNLYSNIPKRLKNDGFLNGDIEKNQDNSFLLNFGKEFIRLWAAYLEGKNYFSNVIYLFPLEKFTSNNVADEWIENLAGVLAHELLHAWGGLNDTYNHESVGTEKDNSLMARIFKGDNDHESEELLGLNCTLSKQQVGNILSYLKSKSSNGESNFSPRLQYEIK